MRKIKFRGLANNQDGTSSMVYGYLVFDLPNSTGYYSTHSQRICWFLEGGGQANQPVMNGTVGQYTGIKDKNGIDIYEGDLLNWDSSEFGSDFVEVVEWNYQQFSMRENDWPNFVNVIGNIHQRDK